MYLQYIFFAESSHEAEKFSKGLKSAGQKLEKYLQQYNKLAGTETLTFQEAKKHDGDVYQDLPAISEVPYPIHRKVTVLLCIVLMLDTRTSQTKELVKNYMPQHTL